MGVREFTGASAVSATVRANAWDSYIAYALKSLDGSTEAKINHELLSSPESLLRAGAKKQKQ